MLGPRAGPLIEGPFPAHLIGPVRGIAHFERNFSAAQHFFEEDAHVGVLLHVEARVVAKPDAQDLSHRFSFYLGATVRYSPATGISSYAAAD